MNTEQNIQSEFEPAAEQQQLAHQVGLTGLADKLGLGAIILAVITIILIPIVKFNVAGLAVFMIPLALGVLVSILGVASAKWARPSAVLITVIALGVSVAVINYSSMIDSMAFKAKTKETIEKTIKDPTTIQDVIEDTIKSFK